MTTTTTESGVGSRETTSLIGSDKVEEQLYTERATSASETFNV